MLWYPVKGDPKTRVAPDVLVAFGRPKGDRGSYRTWEEENVAPQVVFEILSPGNTTAEMAEKLRFYERYGVEEYYLYDPDAIVLQGWLRSRRKLKPIAEMQGWRSPRLQIRFTLADGDLHLFRPDGEEILPPVEIGKALFAVRQRAEAAEQRAERFAAKLRELGVVLE